jgi:hypothetical protein
LLFGLVCQYVFATDCSCTCIKTFISGDRHGLNLMVDGFTTTCICAISAYHTSCYVDSRSWRGVLGTTIYNKVCQWLAIGQWFSPGTPDSSINKIDHHDITEILLKVALNTLTLTLKLCYLSGWHSHTLQMLYLKCWYQFSQTWPLMF